MDTPSGASATAIDDTIRGEYRVVWPTTFFAVVVAGAVTIGIAFLAGPSPNANDFDDVVGSYLARNEIDGLAAPFATPQSIASPRTSGDAAMENANRSERRAPIATREGQVRASSSPIDIAAIALVVIAILHGISVGMLREALSLAALGAAAFVVRVWIQPLANWLQNPAAGPGVRYDIAPWLAGVMIGAGALAVLSTYAHVMRQGARAVGRGVADRLGGAAVGVAHGVLAAGVLLFVTRAVLGPSHDLLASSHTFALLERSERLAGLREPNSRDVAAPPPAPPLDR